MNEKIKTILRIVKPPGYIPLGYYTPQGSFNSWGMSDEELQKFAELIIEECSDICKQFGESGDGYTCSSEILEHFGVEYE